MRGGVSTLILGKKKALRSSPHAWGCFYKPVPVTEYILVFPTCVGVFLGSAASLNAATGLPHMRGGVSRSNILAYFF